MRKNKTVPNKEVDMTSIADSPVRIQTSSDSAPSPPCWFGEVALQIPYLRKQGILSAINSRARLPRRRFGTSLSTDRGTTTSTAPLEPVVCAWLQGAQARGGRAHAHRRLASP